MNEALLDFSLDFKSGEIEDLSDWHDDNGLHPYKYAYFSTNDNFTFLCLNAMSFPEEAIKITHKELNGYPGVSITVKDENYGSKSYEFTKRDIKDNIVYALMTDVDEFTRAYVTFVIDEDDFMRAISQTNINSNARPCKFSFPALEDSNYVPFISKKHKIKSPDYMKTVKAFKPLKYKQWRDNRKKMKIERRKRDEEIQENQPTVSPLGDFNIESSNDNDNSYNSLNLENNDTDIRISSLSTPTEISPYSYTNFSPITPRSTNRGQNVSHIQFSNNLQSTKQRNLLQAPQRNPKNMSSKTSSNSGNSSNITSIGNANLF